MNLAAIPLVVAVWFAAACSAPAQTRCREPETAAHTPPAPDHAAHREDVPLPSAKPGSGVSYAIAAGASDEPVHPRVVHEDSAVKIVVVSIRPGATMPEHATPVPVTVQTVSGAGVMSIGEDVHALAPGTIHVLDAGAPHALRAEEAAPLVLLVHYLKREGELPEHDH